MDSNKLVDQLDSAREKIIEEWIDAVSEDKEIPSTDRLTTAGLRDHFPKLLREFLEQIRHGAPGKEGPSVHATAVEHGKDRWRNGFRLSEVLREIARLREILLRHVSSAGSEIASAAIRDKVSESARHFFDTVTSESAKEFVRGQEGELILRAKQLAHAYEQLAATSAGLRSTSESRLSLLRAINHELRNALQPVTFVADALVDEIHTDEQVQLRARLLAVTNRLESLLDRLLDLSDLLSGEATPKAEHIKVADLRKELEREFRPVVEAKGLRFECVFSAQPTEIVSDFDRLHQIGEILLSNAARYTGSGTVRLEIASAPDDWWFLRISDTGSGFNETDAKHVFNTFQFRPYEEGGLRLGLVLARYLTRLLGGEVTFQTALGKGTDFEVHLPCSISLPNQ